MLLPFVDIQVVRRALRFLLTSLSSLPNGDMSSHPRLYLGEKGPRKASFYTYKHALYAMIPTEIWTERLLLRAVEETDLDAFARRFTDPEVMKYELAAAHTDIGQTKDFIDTTIASPYNGVLDFSVCLSDPTMSSVGLSGFSGCEDVEDSTPMIVIGRVAIRDKKEIEFMLNRQYWGKGFAFEMVDSLLKHFWSTVEDADAVKADVDPRNGRSLRLLERLGFMEVGRAKRTFRTHLGWCDSVYLEVKRPIG